MHAQMKLLWSVTNDLLLLPCSFKTSIAECSKLCHSFPAIVTLVLYGIPVKHWHELDIADHMPSGQCAMALMTKMKALSQADQVCEPWQCHFCI